MRYASLIEDAADRYSLDINLLNAIVYLENSHGYYDEFIPMRRTVRPMNINRRYWRDLIGDRDIWDPATNIDIGAMLLRRIIERIDDPTVASVGSIYNSLGRERVEGYGVDVATYYNERKWENIPVELQQNPPSPFDGVDEAIPRVP